MDDFTFKPHARKQADVLIYDLYYVLVGCLRPLSIGPKYDG